MARSARSFTIDAKGNKYLHNPTLGDFYTLCPSNPRSHEILGQLMVEMVTKYPVDAMHLDRIRYPEAHFCYCPYCKEHFPKETGVAELKEFAAKTENVLGKKLLSFETEFFLFYTDLPMKEILRIAFKGKYIDSMDHPVLRKLRGEV